MYLSGNFGEIRSDHFHSGIDIKTQGVTGHHIYSIESGYVSRIKVQANGYGKSIYIAHPNGYTSVYGHLDRFRPDIAAYVKSIQYQRRSHGVDIYLKPDRFHQEKGEFIAYSGNTGSSSGPHLHFEIRTSGNQHPTNVLKYNFDIVDRVAPRFLSLHVYPTSNGSQVNGSAEKLISKVVSENGCYTLPSGAVIDASGTLGFGVEVFDYLNGSSNRCGVYTLQLFVDDELTYSHVMNEFSFSETRYINAHIDYGERIRSGTKVHRLLRLPNDRMRIYGQLIQNGILDMEENRIYNIRVVATDVTGNRSELKFQVTGKREVLPVDPPHHNYVKIMKYDEPNRFDQGRVTVEIPVNALYQDLEFRYATSPRTNGTLTDIFHIHTPETPVHLPYILSIKAEGMETSLLNKLLLITYDNEDVVSSAGGEYRNGAVVASLRSFGSYAISVDTIAPEIIPLNGSAASDLSGKKALKFTIRDDLSGIEKYEGYIDNGWALFEFDPKNNLLTYTFDSEKTARNTTHELELYVSDAKGNVNLFHTTYTW
ncbi:MAG: M23 family metallopeptidase [Bacteroidales bacterium]|nr:M23 family metallopeptidase [Bacteroidales bacterium]